MSNQGLVWQYVQMCAGGGLGPADCGPIWQLIVIAALLAAAIVALLVLRLRSRLQARAA